jgi:hypothetical protein
MVGRKFFSGGFGFSRTVGVSAVGALLLGALIASNSAGHQADAEETFTVKVAGWVDTNGDGLRSTEEPVLRDWGQIIMSGGAWGEEIYGRSDSLGTTEFTAPAGKYQIRLRPPWGEFDTGDSPCPPTATCTGLPANPQGGDDANAFRFDFPESPFSSFSATVTISRDTAVNWGIRYEGPTSTLTGRVVNDRDGDAFLSDGDTGLAGVRVRYSGFTIGQATSDNNGVYQIPVFGTPSAYGGIVEIERPDGMVLAPVGGLDPLASKARHPSTGEILPGWPTRRTEQQIITELAPPSTEAGLTLFHDRPYENALVEGQIWVDSNANAIRDEGEQNGLQTWYSSDAYAQMRLQLVDTNGTLRWDTTAYFPGGHYQMYARTPCECFVRFLNTERGWEHIKIAPTGQGGDVSRDSDFIERYASSQYDSKVIAETFPQNLTVGTVFDLGITVPATPTKLTGSVWADDNANGIRDAGEAPLAGVRVATRAFATFGLQNSEKAVVSTYTTGPDGTFAMDLIEPRMAWAQMAWVAIDPTSIPQGRELSPKTGDATADDSTHSMIVPEWNETEPILRPTGKYAVGIGLAPKGLQP